MANVGLKTWGKPYAVGVISSDPMKAVLYANDVRREGVSVYTQFGGKISKQYARAKAVCVRVVNIDGEG